MIIELMFKTPDVTEMLTTKEYEEVYPLLEKYIAYSECVTLIFDTEKQTVTVKEV